jgi:hypothetical protein
MKYLLQLLLLTLPFYPKAQSEKGSHQFYSTAGTASLHRLAFDLIQDVFGDGISECGLPVLTVGYQYQFNKRCRIGIEYIYDKFWYFNEVENIQIKSLLFRFDYNWLNNERFTVFSAISGGYGWIKLTENDFNTPKEYEEEEGVAMHLYLIGAEYKMKNFALLINTGLGYSGLVNIGVKYSIK